MKKFFFPEPQIITAGGGSPEFPPDSTAAAAEGFARGADAAYLCVRFTSDGTAVVSEPEKIKTPGGEISISGTEYSSLSALDAAYLFSSDGGKNFLFRDKGIKINTVEEFLTGFPEEKFCIDIAGRSPAGLKNLCAMINNLDACERILFFSYDASSLEKAAAACPGCASAFTLNGAIGFYALYRSGLIYFKKKFKADALIIPEFIGPSYIANQGLIRAARSRGIRVYIYGASGDEQLKRLIDAGADAYITRNVKSLTETLRRVSP